MARTVNKYFHFICHLSLLILALLVQVSTTANLLPLTSYLYETNIQKHSLIQHQSYNYAKVFSPCISHNFFKAPLKLIHFVTSRQNVKIQQRPFFFILTKTLQLI